MVRIDPQNDASLLALWAALSRWEPEAYYVCATFWDHPDIDAIIFGFGGDAKTRNTTARLPHHRPSLKGPPAGHHGRLLRDRFRREGYTVEG